MSLSTHTCFQDRRLKPLGHPSMISTCEGIKILTQIIRFDDFAENNNADNLDVNDDHRCVVMPTFIQRAFDQSLRILSG